MVDRFRISLIGYGAVGRPLAQALAKSGAQLVTIGEHEDSERVRVAQEDGFSVFPASLLRTDVDLLILTVGDQAIETVAGEIAGSIREEKKRNPEAPFGRTTKGTPRPAPVVMHTSGRLGLEPLAALIELGCPGLAWHPIQTFPPFAAPERFEGISIGITCDEDAWEMGEYLCVQVGAEPLRVPEELRAKYHLGSVIASNFLPMLLEMGAQRFAGIADTLEEAWTALLPLVKGMVESMERHGPAGAMTGPVARDDLDAVIKHLNTFNRPDEAELYRAMTRALVSLATRSGRMDDNQALEWLNWLGPGSGRN